MDYLMAIDLGSTSLKAQIYDLDGRCVASASRPTEKVTPPAHPEWVHWDPDQIWQGAAAAAREAVSQADHPASIRAVAVTGMGMDGVPVDRTGRALYPFISWHDPRTAAQAQWWQETIGAERTFAVTGFPTWAITGAMRILWMKEHHPEIMAQTDKWLLIEDFVNHRLCGTVATDYSMASCMLLLDQHRRQWSGELLEAANIDPHWLPQPRPSGTILGGVTESAADLTGLAPGTPVVLGGHDHICGILPCGAGHSGTALDIIGTWESVLLTLDRPVLTEAVRRSAICMQAHVAPGLTAAWGGAVAGESLEWFRRELGAAASGRPDNEWQWLQTELAATRPGAGGVMYLPHLSAAGCPVDDTRSLGAFVGISGQTTRADLLRAVIEGINYQFLDIIETMTAAIGQPLNRLIVTGGASQNEFWVQNKADMLGMPLEVSQIRQASGLGAAMLAGTALGLYASLDEACDRVKRPGRVYHPNPERTAFYRRHFDTYRRLYPALKPVSHRLFDAFKQ